LTTSPVRQGRGALGEAADGAPGEAQGGRSGACGVDAQELKAACLALPGAVEDFPFGDEVSVFKVAGKMFALSDLGADPLQLSIKCEPELAAQLRATYPAIGPGYHLNKRHWNTVTLDGSLPDRMVTDMLGDSYDLVVASLPKTRRPAG
jgi:predicted DNA-binding protein (MmcQ/YjbR family)